MRLAKHLGILTIGLFASCTLFSCSPNVKEQETTKPETSYVLQYQENKKIEEQKAWEVLSREGASIVKGYKERHDKSIGQTGVGIFYGSESYYAEELRLIIRQEALKDVLGESKTAQIKKFRSLTKTDCFELRPSGTG